MKKKILIIDDEELIVKSLTKLLERHGFEVFMIKRGIDAVAIVEEETIDLIISDIKMPGMDGVETMDQIFKIYNERSFPTPSLIFITGYADEKLKERAMRLNPIAFIHKPFDISVLVEQIQKVLK